jgi:predicted ATPase
LKDTDPLQFNNWIEHVRTALPDLETVDSKLRPEDNHRYILLRFANGVTAPSWVVSEGTLRLLALTFLAYAPGFEGIYMIEEPENGVHPTAVETIYQSLSSVYEAQVLMATHSPILVSLANPEQLLCFTRGEEGTSIVRGNDHPVLRDWKKDVSLSDLFAAGVLG